MSARDATTAWDLKCLVREQLVAFMQEHYPHALPRVRSEAAATFKIDERSLVKEKIVPGV